MDFKNSVDRAILLMNTPVDYGKYISIKIKPSHGGCCCFHCWPQTWEVINKYIYPFGPLKDEGDVLIAASFSITKNVIDLIVALLKARENDHHKFTTKFKITRNYQIRNQVKEEEIIELDLPLSNDAIERLNKKIRNAMVKKK